MQMRKKGEWLEITIPHNWVGYSIESVLKNELHVPKKLLHQIRMSKGAKQNGKEVPWSTALQQGDKLQVLLFQLEELGVITTYMDIEVLYEDDHVLVVNKPAGMNVHPNEEGQTNTLANGVAYHYQSQGQEVKVRHIHRLDQDTTGAVVFAKHPLAVAIMDRLLEQRSIKRTYLALVHGKLKQKKGVINERIGKDRHHPSRRRVSPTGQEAVTNYEVLNYMSKNDLSLVKVQLDTGRTHQIRVHLSHLGHPLYGDSMYGSKVKGSHQALHAAKVTFPHPISEEVIECVAPFIDEQDLFPGSVQDYL
ncbi:RluA family pseudouridine synthase [Pontibacillus sp. HMF3514]|uniref:RluA family pseudouridine synthase n=1 Tax=Pontibacillus sp. HMF3514 TaxID=2692425 RepID=UPI00132038C6|nr:RluA family pseudouridine synthase [Pontibacillus sp. HMF3514]QHE54306.1 RluA family pseudouridine synthase [Pontibacillus sp. HMF3514]